MVPEVSTIPEARRKELIRRFTYHTPKGDQVERYRRIRDAAKSFAFLIAELTPDSTEQGIAIRKLEEAVMHANAAIARREYPS